jgi:hypothetical protein
VNPRRRQRLAIRHVGHHKRLSLLGWELDKLPLGDETGLQRALALGVSAEFFGAHEHHFIIAWSPTSGASAPFVMTGIRCSGA